MVRTCSTRCRILLLLCAVCILLAFPALGTAIPQRRLQHNKCYTCANTQPDQLTSGTAAVMPQSTDLMAPAEQSLDAPPPPAGAAFEAPEESPEEELIAQPIEPYEILGAIALLILLFVVSLRRPHGDA